MFGTVLTIAYSALVVYVLWRASSVPRLARLPRKTFLAIGVVLWTVFVLGRFVGHDATGPVAAALESVGMALLGSVFLIATSLLVVDICTAFGLLFRKWVPILRGFGLIAGATLTVVALVQAVRSPAIVSYDVTLPNLPPALDGTVLVAISDAHVGTQRGAPWLTERLGEIEALRPDVVVFLGDIFEGHGGTPRDIPALRRLSPPLGKWFVEGNHDGPGRGRSTARDAAEAAEERPSDLLIKAGFRRLSGRWAEPAPGLILAGVADLTRHDRRQLEGDPLEPALANRPPGATVLLSHTPWRANEAASKGVELMLSGHTHDGQIWPFGYLVQRVYPLLAGRYDVDGMTVIVTRGVGNWGPPMRLWHRAEILELTLHAPRSAP